VLYEQDEKDAWLSAACTECQACMPELERRAQEWHGPVRVMLLLLLLLLLVLLLLPPCCMPEQDTASRSAGPQSHPVAARDEALNMALLGGFGTAP